MGSSPLFPPSLGFLENARRTTYVGPPGAWPPPVLPLECPTNQASPISLLGWLPLFRSVPHEQTSMQCLLARLARLCPARACPRRGARRRRQRRLLVPCPHPSRTPPCLSSPHPLPHPQMMMFDDVMALGYRRLSPAPLLCPVVSTSTPLSHPIFPQTTRPIGTHPLPSASALSFRLPMAPPRGHAPCHSSLSPCPPVQECIAMSDFPNGRPASGAHATSPTPFCPAQTGAPCASGRPTVQLGRNPCPPPPAAQPPGPPRPPCPIATPAFQAWPCALMSLLFVYTPHPFLAS